MLADQRHDAIIRMLAQRGALPVREIAAELSVSEATARRDVDRLAQEGRLSRVYGGAVVKAPVEIPFAYSDATDREEKLAIAETAASLVNDSETVVLDIGSTVLEIARALVGRPITVITGNLMAYDVLKDSAPTELILLGGAVRRNYWSTAGVIAASSMSQLHADVAFLGTSGVTRRGEVLDTTPVEVAVKQQAIRSSDRVVLVAASRKFPGGGQSVVCRGEEITALVTSSRTEDSALAGLVSEGVELLRATGA